MAGGGVNNVVSLTPPSPVQEEFFAKYEEETAKVNEFYLVKVPSTSLPAICQRVSEGRSAFVHFFFLQDPL